MSNEWYEDSHRSLLIAHCCLGYLPRRYRDLEEVEGVFAHDLALHLQGHRQIHDRLRVVEVVVRPVGGEEGSVLAVIHTDDVDEMLRVVRLLQWLRGEPHPLLHVLARALLEKGDDAA